MLGRTPYQSSKTENVAGLCLWQGLAVGVSCILSVSTTPGLLGWLRSCEGFSARASVHGEEESFISEHDLGSRAR